VTDVLIELLDDPVATAVSVGQEDTVEIQVQADATSVSVEVSEFIEVIEQGPTGPPGAAGATYVHTQSTPAATWTIPHNLNTILSVVLLLDSDPTNPVWSDVSYPDLNTAVVSLPSAASGKAYLR